MLTICDTLFSPFAIVAFQKENYNLYYDVNGGTGTPMIQHVPMFGKNYSVMVSSAQPSREGYQFVGWSFGRNGDVQVMPDSTITLDRDIVLYAVWAMDVPKTGDNSHMGLWLTMRLASLLVFTVIGKLAGRLHNRQPRLCRGRSREGASFVYPGA